MEESESKRENPGCFRWVLSAGRTINERWAKSRNRLRERFHRNHPDLEPIGTCDLLNDTGTPDMHLVKSPVNMESVSFGIPATDYGNRQSFEDSHGEYMLMKNARLIHSDEGLVGQRLRDDNASDQPERAIQDMHDLSNLYVADSIQGADCMLEIQTGGGDITQSVKESESCDSLSSSTLSDHEFCRAVHESISWTSSMLSDAADAYVNFALGRVIGPGSTDGEVIETDEGEGRAL